MAQHSITTMNDKNLMNLRDQLISDLHLKSHSFVNFKFKKRVYVKRELQIFTLINSLVNKNYS